MLIWVDALPTPDTATPEPPAGTAVLVGGAGAREPIADWILRRQAELGDRAYVAVVAAGGADGAFAVEDLVAAGAIIDALADRGIDFTSPEAAAAAGAWTALRNAGSHVLTASVAGQDLLASEGPEALDRARAAAASPEFSVVADPVAR